MAIKVNTPPKSITKKQLISILKKEPLFPGQWLNHDIKQGKTCTVCAVGSVIRKIFKGTDAADDYAAYDIAASQMTVDGPFDSWLFKTVAKNRRNHNRAFKSILKEFGPWSALSAYFEYKGAQLTNELNEIDLNSLSYTKKEYAKATSDLVKRCKIEVVPHLVKMVEKHFPDVVEIPGEEIADRLRLFV